MSVVPSSSYVPVADCAKLLAAAPFRRRAKLPCGVTRAVQVGATEPGSSDKHAAAQAFPSGPFPSQLSCSAACGHGQLLLSQHEFCFVLFESVHLIYVPDSERSCLKI